MEEFERNEVEIWPAVAWSMSRRKQFAYCPEAYFLHYGARGWIDFWDARAQRQLECLKQLKSIALWLDAVWSEIFFEYCYHCHTGGSQAALESDNRKINAKSIMGIMAFNPSEGMSVDIVTKGEDEQEALVAIEQFLVCE